MILSYSLLPYKSLIFLYLIYAVIKVQAYGENCQIVF